MRPQRGDLPLGPLAGTRYPDPRIEKLDKLTWDVHASGSVTINYATFWDDPGPFNTQLNQEHAFLNPAMILLYVPERRAVLQVVGRRVTLTPKDQLNLAVLS